MMNKIIEIKKLHKTYPGGIIANSDVNLDVYGGEVHAVLGENGAGKTTLMKVLAGLLKPSSGEIIMGNEHKVAGRSELIGYLPQEPVIIEELDIYDNIALGSETTGALGFYDRDKTKFKIEETAKDYGIELSSKKHLSMSEKQKLMILKQLYCDKKVIIFDEPTTILNDEEKDWLFETIRKLVKKGKSILIISHDLQDMMKIADRITIMSKGKVIKTFVDSYPIITELKRLISKDYTDEKINEKYSTRESGFKIIDGEIIDIQGQDTIELYSGEIFGIAEIGDRLGTALIDRIMGFNVRSRIYLNGDDLSNTDTAQRRKHGIAYIPRDRRGVGVAGSLNLYENLFNPQLTDVILDMKDIKESAEKAVVEYNINCKSIEAHANTLSGGNLQKLIIAREFKGNPKLIIAHDPERGLDFNSQQDLRQRLINASENGATIILISSELSDLKSLCERIGVVKEGVIREIINTYGIDTADIALKLIGANDEYKEVQNK